MPKKKKIVVQTISAGEYKPVHFCDCEADIVDKFYKHTGCSASTVIRIFEKWSIKDFNLKLLNVSDKNVVQFRRDLIEAIRQQYISEGIAPSLLNYNMIASWVTKHMEEELYEQY